MNKKIVIAALHPWNHKNMDVFVKHHSELEVCLIKSKEEFDAGMIYKFNPEYIFFPHWSYYIPKEVYEKYKCIVFHPSDLPRGRGGSPIQNQIVDGMKETKICALEVGRELDAGRVYDTSCLSLLGSAEEIFIRMSDIVFKEMIPKLLEMNPEPEEQRGEPHVYKRRQPRDGEIPKIGGIETAYDYIRMLDACDYPAAFIKWGDKKLCFSNAVKRVDCVEAFVRIENDV